MTRTAATETDRTMDITHATTQSEIPLPAAPLPPEPLLAQDIEDPGNPSTEPQITPGLLPDAIPGTPAGSLSPELLGRALASGFDRQILDTMTQAQIEHALGVASGLASRQNTAPATETNSNEASAQNTDIELSDELGPDGRVIAEAMRRQQAQIAQLASTVQRVTSTIGGHLEQMEHRDSDSYYQSRKDLGHLFGVESQSALNPNSPQYRNRTQVENLAKVYRSGYEANGLAAPAQDTLRQQAINSLFTGDVAAHAQSVVRDEVRQAQSQQMARPTSRQAPPAKANTPEERAENSRNVLRQKIAKFGAG